MLFSVDSAAVVFAWTETPALSILPLLMRVLFLLCTTVTPTPTPALTEAVFGSSVPSSNVASIRIFAESDVPAGTSKV